MKINNRIPMIITSAKTTRKTGGHNDREIFCFPFWDVFEVDSDTGDPVSGFS
jgi:hypothetical protein